MTDFDLALIQQAEKTSRYSYSDVDDLIRQAQSDEARRRLSFIRWELYDLMMETI